MKTFKRFPAFVNQMVVSRPSFTKLIKGVNSFDVIVPAGLATTKAAAAISPKMVSRLQGLVSRLNFENIPQSPSSLAAFVTNVLTIIIGQLADENPRFSHKFSHSDELEDSEY